MLQNKRSWLASHPLAAVFTVMTLCLIPAMLLRDYSPSNELRYLNIVDEAISGGHVFAFTCQGQPYADKPPLYFWLLALSRLLFGKHVMFFMALFSYIPALVIIWIMDKWLALKGFGERAAVALMMGTTGMFLALSVFLRMDMLMCMFIVLALYTFWRMYTGEGNRRRQELLLPLWIFMALFTKGPVGVLMPPLVIVTFLLVRKEGRQMGRYLGWKTWAVIAALCALWFTGVYLDGGKEYLNNLLFHQTVDRAVNSFHHKKPLWYYLTAIWYVLIPYSILLIGSVVASLRKRRGDEAPHSAMEVFFLTAVLVPFVMLSLFSSKLSVYLAPIFPFMVLLFVTVLRRTGWKKWMTVSLAVVQAFLAAVCVIALAVKLLASGIEPLSGLMAEYPIARNGLIWSAVAFLGAGLLLALYWLIRRKSWKRSVAFTALGLLIALYTASFAMDEINSYIGYGNLCREIPEGKRVATVGVHRPENMDVYLGHDIVDYQKDFVSFYANEIEGENPQAENLVLITSDHRVKTNGPLRKFVLGRPHRRVGAFYIVDCAPQN